MVRRRPLPVCCLGTAAFGTAVLGNPFVRITLWSAQKAEISLGGMELPGFLGRSAWNASTFMSIPGNRVMKLESQVEL